MNRSKDSIVPLCGARLSLSATRAIKVIIFSGTKSRRIFEKKKLEAPNKKNAIDSKSALRILNDKTNRKYQYANPVFLAKGGFGSVWKVDKPDRTSVAVKLLDLKDNIDLDEVPRELYWARYN